MTNYLTVPEVAEIIRKAPDYVQRQCRAGHLKGKKLGNDWRIAEDSVQLFMSGETHAPRARGPRTARQKRRSA